MKKWMMGLTLAAVMFVASDGVAYTCGFELDECVTWCEESVTYQVGNLPAGLPEDEAISAIQDAAALWDELGCGIELVYDGRLSGTQASLQLEWEGVWDQNWGVSSTTISTALLSSSGQDCLSPSQIKLNDDSFQWFLDGTQDPENQQVDVFSVAVNAFGLGLGLGGSTDPNSVMNPSNDGPVAALGTDDIDGLCAYYPPATGAEDMGADAGSQMPDAGTVGGEDMGIVDEDMGMVATSEPDLGSGGPLPVVEPVDSGDGEGCQSVRGGRAPAPATLLLVLGLLMSRRFIPRAQRANP